MAQPYVTGPAHFFVGKVISFTLPQTEATGPALRSDPVPPAPAGAAPGPQLQTAPLPNVTNIQSTATQQGSQTLTTTNTFQLGTGYLWSAAQGATGDRGTATIQQTAGTGVGGTLIQASVPTLRVIYLGTTETTPRLQFIPHWAPVYSDLTGDEVPYDVKWNGEEAVVTGRFNRYNELTLAFLQTRPGPASPQRGIHGSLDYGVLMGSEGGIWSLFVMFPNGARGNSLMSPIVGYRFPGARLAGPDDFMQLGTRHRQNDLAFHCIPVIDPYGNTLLYDHNVPSQLLTLVN